MDQIRNYLLWVPLITTKVSEVRSSGGLVAAAIPDGTGSEVWDSSRGIAGLRPELPQAANPKDSAI